MNYPRLNLPRTMVSSPWTDKALEYIFEVTRARSRASLLTPAAAALLVSLIEAMEAGDSKADPELLARGRALLEEYSRMNPAPFAVARMRSKDA